MGMFSGIDNAKARIDANYLRDGDYYLRIDEVKQGKTRSNDEFLVVEMTVLAVVDGAEGKGHKVGEKVSHMMMKKHDSFLGNVKAFIANTLQCREEEVVESKVEEIINEKLFNGMFVRTQNRTVMTRKNTPFTAINYRGPVTAMMVEQVSSPEEIARVYSQAEWDKLLAAESAA